jgi:hypothetical protein
MFILTHGCRVSTAFGCVDSGSKVRQTSWGKLPMVEATHLMVDLFKQRASKKDAARK